MKEYLTLQTYRNNFNNQASPEFTEDGEVTIFKRQIISIQSICEQYSLIGTAGTNYIVKHNQKELLEMITQEGVEEPVGPGKEQTCYALNQYTYDEWEREKVLAVSFCETSFQSKINSCSSYFPLARCEEEHISLQIKCIDHLYIKPVSYVAPTLKDLL